MKYKIVITDNALKQYRKINNPFKEQIKNKVDELVEFSSGSKNIKPLKGEFSGLYRLRVGNYRVIFQIEVETLIIIAILHRKEAYK